MKSKIALTLAISISLTACSGSRPTDIGVNQNQLKACPSSPNCVSSFSQISDEIHYISPVTSVDEEKWKYFKHQVMGLNWLSVVESQPDYLYLEATSDLMKFVDDVEIYWKRADQTVHFRSASRLGYGDMGVNRERIEKLKALF